MAVPKMVAVEQSQIGENYEKYHSRTHRKGKDGTVR